MAQVWLVTGSSRGLGHAIVEAGLAAGNKVLATARDIRSLADPDILELFHEDAEVYFPKFGFGSGRTRFLKWLRDSKEPGIHSTRLRPFDFHSFSRLSRR